MKRKGPKPPPHPLYLTSSEAAAVIGCSVQSVHKMAKDGIIRTLSKEVRTIRRFLRADVERLAGFPPTKEPDP